MYHFSLPYYSTVHPFRRGLAGFTLVELVVAISIAGVVLTGIVVASVEMVKRSADPMMALQRLHVAESYLDEISAKKFALIGANCGEPAGGRADYTHICQYDAITNDDIEDQAGTVIASLANYQVSVDVSNTVTGDSNLGDGSDFVPASMTALVTVTVTSPDGGSTRLSRYIVDG